MLSFVSTGPLALQAPRWAPSAGGSIGLAAVQPVPTPLDGSANLSSIGSFASATLVLAAAALSVFTAARRRASKRSRVVLGPTGGCYYPHSYRAKAGDKFKYRFPTDRHLPEYGVWPNIEEGRIIRYGKLFQKGTVRMPMKSEDDKYNIVSSNLKGSEPGALLLDCDGTLVETERDGHRVAFNKAFKEKGFDFEWDVDIYGQLLTTGGGKERIARYFTDYNPGAWIQADPASPSHPLIIELHELKTELFLEIVKSGELSLRPGIKELIREADEAGWRLAVCSTSAEASVRAVVETLLPDYADKITIFAGDVVADKKPDPAIYNLAAKKLGVAPMKCVVVEDTAIGAKAGMAAGMSVVVTKSIYSAEEDFGEADVIVDSAADLDFKKNVAALLPTLQFA